MIAGRALPAFHRTRSSGELARKAEAAAETLHACDLCEWRCGTDRASGRRGRCGVLEPRIDSEFIHTGEEPELVPSHTIFTSGCNFRCLFCQNHGISQHPERGSPLSAIELAEVIDLRWGAAGGDIPLFPVRPLAGGGRNVNFVGGEPTPNMPFILETLLHVEAPTPVVWNSNMYMTEGSMSLLDGAVDLYLADLKYGNDECARRLSGVERYMEVVGRNHVLGERHADLLIRHLVLPGHVECCSKPVIDWISENLRTARINIMDQYRPEWRAHEAEGLCRRLTEREFSDVMGYAREVLDPVRFPLEPVL